MKQYAHADCHLLRRTPASAYSVLPAREVLAVRHRQPPLIFGFVFASSDLGLGAGAGGGTHVMCLMCRIFVTSLSGVPAEFPALTSSTNNKVLTST